MILISSKTSQKVPLIFNAQYFNQWHEIADRLEEPFWKTKNRKKNSNGLTGSFQKSALK